MKYILIFLLSLQASTWASSTLSKEGKKQRLEKQIKQEIEKEKKYAKEQTFYNSDNYDFKRSEVNPESLSTIPEIEVDDLDMDSVYD
jgi:sortase (surface protein transpeptidase)